MCFSEVFHAALLILFRSKTGVDVKYEMPVADPVREKRRGSRLMPISPSGIAWVKVSICGVNQSLPKGPGRFWVSNTEMRKNILFTTKCAKKGSP